MGNRGWLPFTALRRQVHLRVAVATVYQSKSEVGFRSARAPLRAGRIIEHATHRGGGPATSRGAHGYPVCPVMTALRGPPMLDVTSGAGRVAASWRVPPSQNGS